MAYLILNGKLLSEDKAAVPVSNRSFRYGDGLFETMLIANGTVPFYQAHWNRLTLGLSVLNIDFPESLDKEALRSAIQNLVEKNKIGDWGYVRLNVFRSGKGKYLPETTTSGCCLEVIGLENPLVWNEEGLRVELFHNGRKSTDVLANVKTNSALLYVMAAQYAQSIGVDDCLIQNVLGHIIEGSSSNLFLIKDTTLITPPLSAGPIAGVMRQTIIELLHANGYMLIEQPVTEKMLNGADEAFLCNAVRGVQWIRQFEKQEFGSELSRTIHQVVVEHIQQLAT